LIFFENQEAVIGSKKINYEFSAQASAVAAKSRGSLQTRNTGMESWYPRSRKAD
jgi:hypothetical protein